MFLPEVSIKRPVLATMMIAALVLFGLISRERMGIALYPDVDFPIVSISTTLQGASPDVVETELTDPIEEAISAVEGIKHISSQSSQDMSRVTVEFELERNIDIAAQDVRDKIALANRYLPRDADSPVVNKVDIGGHPIIWIAVHGDLPRKYLGQIADETLKPRFETISGVGGMVIGGLQKREMRLWLDAGKMEAHNITADDVEQAVRNKNIEMPGGRVESPTRELAVKTLGELKNEDEFNNLIIVYTAEAPVRLRDIGFAQDDTEDRRSVGRYNGINAIGLGIIPRSGSNHVDVCRRVKETMLQMRELLPAGVVLDIAYDSSEFIKNSIADVQFELFFGGILAAIVVFLFLRNIRPTVIVALAIPTSIIGAFSIMAALGFTMNTMTMLALSLCVGLVIDDAIVVMENAFRHGEMGKDPVTAALDGTNEIAFAVIATTLAIVAVFVPVAFIKGLIGRFYFQFGVTVTASVVISTFVALTLTPMLCSRFLRVTQKHGRLYVVLERAFRALERRYCAGLAWSLHNRTKVIIGALVIFLASLSLFKFLGVELVQKEDRDDFIVRIECPVGSSLEFADQKLHACETIIRAMPELESLFALVGAGGPRSTTNKGFLFVQLKPSRERTRAQIEIMTYLRRELNTIPGMVAYVEDITALGGGMGGRNAPMQFVITGPDLDQLAEISKNTIDRLRQVPGIVDVGSDMEITKPEVQVSIDRDKAGLLGVDVRTIASAVNTLIGGREIGSFKDGGKSYDVRVRLIPEQRTSLEDINRLLVRNRQGALIRLDNIVRVAEDVGPDMINRRDRLRSISIYADFEGDKTLGSAVADTKAITAETVPPGYLTSFAGQAETMAETGTSFLFAFFLTILIIYMVLASQFESFIHPLTVMLALPLSMIGALGFLLITGNTINIMSLIGMLMLVGLVVKNSILLVDYTNVLRARGLSLYEAVLQASPVRMRPILMTAISTIAGVTPVALGLGSGSETRAPMALAVIGGLSTSTLLTLFVVPVVYTLLDELRTRTSRSSIPDMSGASSV